VGAASRALFALAVVVGGATAACGFRPALAQVAATTTSRPQATTPTSLPGPGTTARPAPTTAAPASTTAAPATSSTVRRPPVTRVTTTTTTAPPITAVSVPATTIPSSTTNLQAAGTPGEGHVSPLFPALSGAGVALALAILAGRWIRNRSGP